VTAALVMPTFDADKELMFGWYDQKEDKKKKLTAKMTVRK
jgi:hypothetical protein